MMAAFRRMLIEAGLAGFAATKLHRLVGPITRGLGAILTFHQVRPGTPRPFAPNRALEITPDHLDAVVSRVKALGYRIITLDEVLPTLRRPGSQPFVVLTFDDGYRDTLVHALPILERHNAPFALFVTTGFADRVAPLWWLDLEKIIRTTHRLSFVLKDERFSVPLESLTRKRRGFDRLAALLRRQPHETLLAAMATMGRPGDISTRRSVEELCLGWTEIEALAAHPLVTIGCHTRSHANLARLDASALQEEIAGARVEIEHRIGRTVRHLAYPYGSPEAAGLREFKAARETGFATAVTTRPSTLFPHHADHATALPRISVNGLWPDLDVLEILLSGAPFAVWRQGKRIDHG